jgi:hypothetical protein
MKQEMSVLGIDIAKLPSGWVWCRVNIINQFFKFLSRLSSYSGFPYDCDTNPEEGSE